jgi:peptidoglycan biosynthesis protein MviN/MurJ (putative lipid II flippase)
MKMENTTYPKRILTIILLTNIPALLILPLFFKEGLGWILGSIASAVNFMWLARNVRVSLNLQPTKSKLNAVKGTYLRLLFLLVYAVLILQFIKPNLAIFGFGLLAAQIVIYMNELISSLRNSKFFRGRNG